ncbi:MAG: S9 family peptidase [Bacteroidota bacterium]
MRFSALSLALLLLALPAWAQPARDADLPPLSVETLFTTPTFFGDRFQGGRWAEEGPVLTYIENDRTAGATHLMRYDLATGERTIIVDGSTLQKPDGDGLTRIEDYAYSADKSTLLLYTDSERVWRLNTKGYYYLLDVESGNLTPISDRDAGFQMFAKLSPDGSAVAFVRDRNLFHVDLATRTETQLTDDGADGGIINGTFDWVYEEEFGLRDGFRWSPDGRYLAFFQLDESATRPFTIIDNREFYPTTYTFRYPKAGEVNSEVRIGVIDTQDGAGDPDRTMFLDTDTWFEGGEATEYLALMDWTPPDADGASQVWMVRLNRDQNDLDLLYGDPETGALTTVLEEQSETWLDVETGFSDLDLAKITYLDGGERFVWRSDRSGFNHLYLYERDGTLLDQITDGDWDVTSFNGLDEDAGLVYVTGTKDSPRERHLYAITLPKQGGLPGTDDAGTVTRITQRPGWHSLNPSSDLRYYLDTWSDATTPSQVTLHALSPERSDGDNAEPGDRLATLVDNAALAERVAGYNLPGMEFMQVPAADGTPLEAYMIKPSDFDSTQAYPLLFHIYGGPGAQEVRDSWGGVERVWHQMLVDDLDIIVVGVDNRGTGGKGKAFKSVTYKRLGVLEAEDQIAAAKHLSALPYIDADRTGIWGWSYGGFLALNAMLMGDGPQTFEVGIAGAPVTDWRYYDTIYTERYMSTPQKNDAGYTEGSPVTYAANLDDERQDLLIVHGDYDDNVHVQNTVVMVEALQDAGKQFDFMLYPGQAHGALYGQAVHYFTLMTDYIAEHLASPDDMAMGGTR